MIQWYPGHMKKARDEITDVIQRVDVVIEILDARLPVSSSNPVLHELRRRKPCIRILNKSDLADPVVTGQWVAELEKDKTIRAVPVVGHERILAKILPQMCYSLAENKLKRALRAIVVGIPNSGKSTLINTLAGRKLAKTGNQPAVTRQQQKVSLKGKSGNIDISDTPGILWPNLADRDGAYKLAASGAIRDTVLDFQDVAIVSATYILNNYGELVVERYKLDSIPEKGEDLLEEIGRRRGCLRKGGVVNMQKAAEIFINELRGGTIGRISLEKP